MVKSSSETPSAPHPYSSLPNTAYWRTAVADRHFSDLESLWKPKFKITPRHRIATFGSCFAQNIGRALKVRGYNWLNTEPAPDHTSPEVAKDYNYGIFTCRTANIYTSTLLLQWTKWALGEAQAPAEAWQNGGRYYDPFRPAIEPDGFSSAEEMLRLRNLTIEAFGKAIRTADFFVFTLGLTESWWNKAEGYEYPSCPGTIAGEFDAAKHEFRNLSYPVIAASMSAAFRLMRSVNPRIKFILTVSPVPLTASNSGNHVLVATMESKSILRAVAGHFDRAVRDVMYFPSYEIITSPVTRGTFFEPNQRSISPMGVDFVMKHFFGEMEDTAVDVKKLDGNAPAPIDARTPKQKTQDDVVCEEELLNAFAPSA